MNFSPWVKDFRASLFYSTVSIIFLFYASFLVVKGDITSLSMTELGVAVVISILMNRFSARKIASGERRMFGIEVEKKYVSILISEASRRGWKVSHNVAIKGRRENVDALMEKNGRKYIVEIKSMSSQKKIQFLREKHKKQIIRQSQLMGTNGKILWYPLAVNYSKDIGECKEVGGLALNVIEVAEYMLAHPYF